MNKSNFYKNEFLEASNRIQYVLDHSNLPGPRGNLELIFAVQDVGDDLFFNALELVPPLLQVSSKSMDVPRPSAARNRWIRRASSNKR